jgi:hypothetical protein
MSKINFNSIKQKASNSKKVESTGDKLVNKLFTKNKNNFLNEFDNHIITKELEAGPGGNNISNTLGGKGNLFSFIGFLKSQNPIEELRSILEQNFSFKKSKMGNKLKYIINFPDLEKVKKATPMPWENGNSWVVSIERGISGLSYYLSNKFSQKSRSGRGVQTKGRINSLNYKPTDYLSTIIKNFKRNFK